ncbi:Zinc/iron permease [Penicillium argentinense]|uniref:Zinc/iron permease n=1 Tax=Penicillium argentinense TaxID=1131581 RepID=A0A9W9EHY3_9EURO|nr:Zinc/iron permease [Penicillium argentinense]KAJ5082152.1 Zinc/iron permease [Penicillium argentinense]
MNCPSRTDDTLLHDEWNQNPPQLAPDLTTRQDLIGISNARVKRDDEKGSALLEGTLDLAYAPSVGKQGVGDRLDLVDEASLTQSGRLVTGKDPSPIISNSQNLNQNNNHFFSAQRIKDWALWLLSVVCVSILITRIGSSGHAVSPQALLTEDPSAEEYFTKPAKRSRCASGGVRGDTYDLRLHVAALFIILTVSGFACAFPILATRFPRLHVPPSFLFFVSHFGTGVLIATAFVHLLPTAFTSLGDPCLSDFWTKDYPAMPGAIALGGIFLVTVIEMVFSPARHVCRGGNRIPQSNAASSQPETSPRLDDVVRSASPRSPTSPVGLEAGHHLRDMGPLIGRSVSISRAINRMGEGNEEVVYLLEMGILFHSVFIGMSLSVSVGNEFVVLLIAIVFHQTFEGLALGSRIAALPWGKDQLQPWIMSLAYGCTTPIGQAIGLATHTLYSPDSEVGLLVVGAMNAISSGLLIFASLVELMSEDFLSDESWRVLRGKKRVYACILVFLGAFCMSIVGAWA